MAIWFSVLLVVVAMAVGAEARATWVEWRESDRG